MPRTCRNQARLSTRKPLLRAAAKAQSASPARHFDLGGGFGSAPSEDVVDFTQRPARAVELQAERRRSFGEPAPPQWEEARKEVKRYFKSRNGEDGESSSDEEDFDAKYGPPPPVAERLSKIKSAVLKAKTLEEVEEVKAAMRKGADWRKVAPWIRRSPTLAEYRREEEGKPCVDWVGLAGLRQTSGGPSEEQPAPSNAKPRKVRSRSPRPPRDAPPPSDDEDADISPTAARHPSSVTMRGAQRALREKGARFGEELPPLRPQPLYRGLETSTMGLERAMEAATASMMRNSWSLPQLQSHVQREAGPRRLIADAAPKPDVDPEPLRFAPSLIRRRVRVKAKA